MPRLTKTAHPCLSLCLAILFSGSFSLPVIAESKISESAQLLLKEVKLRDIEREMAAKQTEFNRLSEDLAKVRGEADDLKRSIGEIDTATGEASSNLERLSAERARLAQALEVATLRVEAEKLKVTGLKMLSEGQGKVLGYTTNRSEATERKVEIAAAELKLISGQNLPAQEEEIVLDPNNPQKPSGGDTSAKLKAQIADLKKKGAKSQQALLDASTAATSAINGASAKLAQADAAAMKASQRADELGLAAGLAPVAVGPDDEPAITAPKATVVRPLTPAAKSAASTPAVPPAIVPSAASKKPATSSRESAVQ